MAEQDVATQSQDLTPEDEARKMGWKPQDEYEGNPDRWVTAEEFVERGQQILPILTQNNKRLKDELSVRDQRIEALNQSLQDAQSAIGALKEHQTESTKRAVEQAKKDVLQQLREARESGDVDAEFQLSEKLADLRNTERSVSAATAEVKNDPPKPIPPTPELLAWQQENPWFDVDKDRTSRFLRIAAALRASGNTVVGKGFVDEVSRAEQELDSINSVVKTRTPVSRVDSSSASPRTVNGSAKSFNSLPDDAKRACIDYSKSLVGANKAFKTIEEWKSQYTKDYYNEN